MSLSKGAMSIETVARDLRDFLEEDRTATYRLIVGSDSQPHGAHRDTLFVTAIVIHRVGRGARFYFCKRGYKKPLAFRQRIFSEAAMALEVVQALEAQLETLGTSMPIEIHLDVGEDGETKALIKDLVGWVTQSGYEAKIKPNSFGASKVADRFTKS
ncbi:ribonuclease H-like YkuK family protein [Ferroacidibacillus organovorans]|uniref:DUF458 domain-containing protein n=1 Tax=Ferroacidibacillus organovorans TaxID=1765683 RepID=A0A168C2S0_9BACL|nr:ribonuclease H-like YkuK family protein [Ferroacidibacillus organovorans]KYP81495.1 hypothetical protein AYJ22_07115 [Ferroacidibacillus organovorans]OAG94071.1 hypothetical protein AYW79_07530 [Ferroacidibacillus organovorans]OPG16852.1 hypothetical protein B2M26_04410 [Ferroacidibacillus organovorans]